MPPDLHTIYIQPLAPVKPAVGAPCNGCGVCCLAEPCPLGMVISRKRRGACDALQWNDAGRLYRCGAVAAPLWVVQQALPHRLRGLAPALAWGLGKLARRWIAAGTGCDSNLISEPVSPEPTPSGTMQTPSIVLSSPPHDSPHDQPPRP